MTNAINIIEDRLTEAKDKLEKTRKAMDAGYNAFYENPDDSSYLKLHKLNSQVVDILGEIYVLERALEQERGDSK